MIEQNQVLYTVQKIQEKSTEIWSVTQDTANWLFSYIHLALRNICYFFYCLHWGTFFYSVKESNPCAHSNTYRSKEAIHRKRSKVLLMSSYLGAPYPVSWDSDSALPYLSLSLSALCIACSPILGPQTRQLNNPGNLPFHYSRIKQSSLLLGTPIIRIGKTAYRDHLTRR